MKKLALFIFHRLLACVVAFCACCLDDENYKWYLAVVVAGAVYFLIYYALKGDTDD